MFERALAATVLQSQGTSAELRQALRDGDCYECEALRRHLEQEIAFYLAEADPRLRAIYRFDPTFAFGEDAREQGLPSESSAINLLAWTGEKSSELTEQISALCRAFADARAKWLCPKAVEWCHALNIAVIDDAEIKERHGYAVLLDSLWVRPTRLWNRCQA